jgi:alkylation response protein AidB-like acyl-CoA dehydrogenase
MTAVVDTPSRVLRPRTDWGGVLAAGWPHAVEPPAFDPGLSARERLVAAAATGLAMLPIPEDFGGGGGSLLESASAQRNLALTDPSAAVALNMHVLSVGLLAEHWRRQKDTSWMLMEAIANGPTLVGSAFAERGGSANILRSNTRAVRTTSGFRLTGTKYPCSLATTAELFCLSAQVEGEDTSIVALCPAAAPGVRVIGEWPSLGMRSSDTAGLDLAEVELDRRLVFHEAPVGTIDDVVIGGLVWFVVLIGATYHGVLSALVETAAAMPPRLPPISREATLGAVCADLVTFGLACQGLARGWSNGQLDGNAALVAAASLRRDLSALTDRATAGLRPLLGAAAYTQDTLASSLLLDALAAHHHPPALPLCDALIGAAGSGRDVSLDIEP